jgi:hypothetical protein
MLYDMIPERVEQFIFVPFLTGLFMNCEARDGYWTFLEEIYPTVYYEHGDVNDYSVNDPQSYLLDFILRRLDYKHSLSTDDLPFYESLVQEEVKEETAPMLVQEKDGNGNVVGMSVVEWPYYEVDEDDYPPEPEVVGHKLEFDIETIRKRPEYFSELLNVLDKDGFLFKVEYNAARAYLDALNSRLKERGDDLNDLL